MKKNTIERMKMVKAMEFITRQINDEDIFMGWLYNGVADGDIKYGDLDITAEDEENLYCYCDDDKDFADLMALFLRLMAKAHKDGGLFCNWVCSDGESLLEKFAE
ncbi:MAG: hypothetical protein IIZ93_14900 [Acidaminococcaceae bacterium]|nr:hypothetical protein [Acidaminococcaceae bacterium]